mgnify:CR=1 FL=1
MSILKNLINEGTLLRDLSKEVAAYKTKWEKTGLLEGLNEVQKNNMAVLLQNQSKQLLKEASTMVSGRKIEQHILNIAIELIIETIEGKNLNA